MKKLFVYGTLLNEELLSALIKKQLVVCDAVLPGYHRTRVWGESYPAIRPNGRSSVKGKLICNLSPSDIQALDEYEGELYKCMRVRVKTEHTPSGYIQCETYVLKKHFYRLLSPYDWCNEEFRARCMDRYIRLYCSR